MHKHHLVPRHRDPNSVEVVEVTVTQHAMFHYCEWRLHGRRQDWLAWKSLTRQINNEEIWLERSAIGGRNNAGKPKSVEHRAKIAKANSISRGPQGQQTVERRAKISKSMTGNTNSHSQKTPEARARHSEIMKAVWARRKGNATS